MKYKEENTITNVQYTCSWVEYISFTSNHPAWFILPVFEIIANLMIAVSVSLQSSFQKNSRVHRTIHEKASN